MNPQSLSATEYRLLVACSPVMLWRSGLDAKCDYFNDTWLAFTGRTMAQERGDGWAEGVHPDDLERCVEHYLSHFHRREAFEMEYRLRRHDGAYRWIFDRGVPFTDDTGEFAGFIGSCVDVDDRRRAQAERERQFHEQLAEALPVIVWTHDSNGVATYFNRRWTDYSGLTRAETLAQGVGACLHEEDSARVLRAFADGRRGREPFAVTYRLRRHDGVYRWHEARVVPYRRSEDGREIWLGTAIDIDDQYRAAEEQRFLARASEVLSSTLEVSRTLSELGRLLVPTLADWFAVDLLGPDGTLERASVAHVDPEKVSLAWELWRTNPPQKDDPHGVYAAIKEGRPELLHIDEDLLVRAVPDPKLRELIRSLGLRSSICVPLRARNRDLGALTLVTSESGRRYGSSDVVFASEVASRISLAIDNAELYEEAKRARDVAEAIAEDVREQSRAVEAELLTMRDERDKAVADLARANGARAT